VAKQARQLLSVTESAKILKITGRQVRNLIRDGLLPAEQIGGMYLINRPDLAKVPKRKPGPVPKESK
jgi:excisionase family DNA binding protein